MATMLTAAVAFLPTVTSARAERARSPADAVVFIRITGSLHADISRAGIRETVDLNNVEIGSGSGFVISPYGYVLTNEHVVSDAELFLVADGMREATVKLSVSNIDVCFQADTVATWGLSSPCATASVAASDRDLDLAVLFISGSNLPYIALGDSDAVTVGLAVEALGYPFGRDVDVGRVVAAPEIVPAVSTTPGAISALRANEMGERRYLQITNSLNPGNSGGPLVDRDGFAVGVICMKLAKASDIGFAIPVNEAKNLLEARGLDQLVSARRLRLGAFQSLESKGIGLRLPEGFTDTSPFQSRVETEAHALDVALRIDRVLSSWSLKQIERALLEATSFEPLSMAPRDGVTSARSGSAGLLLGSAHGTAADTRREFRMDYAVLDLGAEKLVARYVGPAEVMAFNQYTLHESLASLQAQRFLPGGIGRLEELQWSIAPLSAGAAVPTPLNWTVEPGRPAPCPVLPPPAMVSSAFPPHDLSIVLRAAVWSADAIVPMAAASACSTRRGSLGDASYASQTAWLGTVYIVEGIFTRAGPRIVQLEVLSTTQKSAMARALLALWLKRATE